MFKSLRVFSRRIITNTNNLAYGGFLRMDSGNKFSGNTENISIVF